MTLAAPSSNASFPHRHLLGIEGLSPAEIVALLDLSEEAAELSRQMGGNSLKHFVESLDYWTRDNALEIDLIEESDKVLSFNVTRCRYAELYERLGIRDIGAIFSCTRDFALIEGFNTDISLKRTQTIMEGANYCDFRYRRKKSETS